MGTSNWVFWGEYPMVRWLEANGYDVSYSTDVDTARRGAEILEHQVFLSVGHDEYWSGEMRANVEAARDAGVDLAFFSGNEMYWKTRWENSIDASGTAYRTLVCYKESVDDGADDPTNIWTGQWRDMRRVPAGDMVLPEQLLTGQIWSVNRGPGGDFGTAIKVPEAEGKMRFWRNTSVATLSPGQTATLANGTLGYEWDEDVDNGYRPAGTIRMSSTTENVPEKLVDPISWPGCDGSAGHPCSIVPRLHGRPRHRDPHADPCTRHPAGRSSSVPARCSGRGASTATTTAASTTPDVRMRQATVNLFADMGVQPEIAPVGSRDRDRFNRHDGPNIHDHLSRCRLDRPGRPAGHDHRHRRRHGRRARRWRRGIDGRRASPGIRPSAAPHGATPGRRPPPGRPSSGRGRPMTAATWVSCRPAET